MNVAKPSVLLLAALVDSPALYGAFVAQDMDATTALLRFLIAVPVCALMLSGLKVVTRSYHEAYLDAKETAAAEARAAALAEAEAEAAELARRRYNDEPQAA